MEASVFPASDFEPTDATQGLREEGLGCMVRDHLITAESHRNVKINLHKFMFIFQVEVVLSHNIHSLNISVSLPCSQISSVPSLDLSTRSSFLRSVALPVANLPWNNNFKRRAMEIGIGDTSCYTIKLGFF